MSYKIDPRLANGYSQAELFKIIDSFKSLSFNEKILLQCYLTLFIGLEDNSIDNEMPIRVNLAYISEKINHKVEDLHFLNQQ